VPGLGEGRGTAGALSAAAGPAHRGGAAGRPRPTSRRRSHAPTLAALVKTGNIIVTDFIK
jgi:hypothetical protein